MFKREYISSINLKQLIFLDKPEVINDIEIPLYKRRTRIWQIKIYMLIYNHSWRGGK